jgi:hypothetical protein
MNGKVGAQGIEAGMTAGADHFRTAATTIAFSQGNTSNLGR